MKTYTLILKIMIFIMTVKCVGTTYYVDSVSPDDSGNGLSWATAKKTVQGAIDICANGDSVRVTDGVYNSGGKRTPGAYCLTRVCIVSNVTVTSINGPAATIIVGQTPSGFLEAIRCVYMSAGSLNGFTLSNGCTVESGDVNYDTSGGGANLFGGNAVLSNCWITANNAPFGVGGGAYCGTLNNCRISGNMAIKGAGTYNSKVNNSTIIANRAVSNGGGAARGTLINCIISGNTVIGSYSSGGGIDEVVAYNCVICDNTAVATCGGGGGANGGMLNNCTISGNQAAWLGGGINRATADHCTIISNSANPSGGGEGGGAAGSMLTSCNIIANSAGSAGGGVNNCTINNCVISGNNSNRGGGIYRAIANNCTIIRNSSMTEAGGAYASTLRNSIIWSNLTVGAGNNYFSSTLEYSCTLPLSIGTGNISADPQFVGSTLTLPDISPCVDVGNNAYAPLPNDIMSNPRIIGGRVDMGAYENTRYLPYYPNVCLTSVPVEVSYEIKTMIVAGTNNQYVSGMMWFTNSLYIADATSFLATTSWVTPEMHLSVGVNNIVIHGSNVYKDISVAVLPIVRGGIGTGIPAIATTSTPLRLSYDRTTMTISGTNNRHVIGYMWWTNTTTGTGGTVTRSSTKWSFTFVAQHNSNDTLNSVYVFGTNLWKHTATNSLMITVGGIGTGAPYVDITNILAGPVNNSMSNLTVAGTNNPHVVGTMWLINAADGSCGTFDASPSWQAAVPIQVGLNTIAVCGTNLWTLLTNDTISVVRLPGAPGNVTATDGAFPSKVRVAFAASVGATKYEVYRAPASTPTNFTALSGEISVTSYDDATVDSGQQYYYAVQSGSSYGWSALSASDSGFALFTINAGEWKFKAGAKVNKKGKMTGKDTLKGAVVNPPLMPYFAQGWRIGIAWLINGSLSNCNGPYTLTPNKSQKLWQVKDPAKGTPKISFIKYSVNDKKGDKLDYQLWTNMPVNKVVYILPTNVNFSTSTLLNEQDNSEPPVQFRLQPKGKANMNGWQELDTTVIETAE